MLAGSAFSGAAWGAGPTAPGSLTATGVSSTQNALRWVASSDTGGTITAYVIQRCQGSGCSSFTQIASIAPGTAYLDTALSAATSYSYRVEAEDSNSLFSPWSNTASATTFAASVSSAITYGYDALGRLVQASVASNSTVENYTYDKSGNITSIQSNPTTSLGFANVSNSQGSVGSQITIYGSGFSTTPTNNTVQFNGTAATVASATSTQLVVTVPSGATTGSISVKTGTTTVTSANPFSVVAAAGAPTIGGFSPMIAVVGSALAITGTGFQTTPANNKVLINQTWATVLSATPTLLTVAVPTAAASGLITIATPGGSATSTSNLIIAPSGYTLAQIGSSGTMVVNGSAVNISLPVGSKSALELFSGTAGADLAIAISGKTLTAASISVYAPNGSAILTNVTVPANGQAIQVPTLPMTGTYTVLTNPTGYTGAVTLTLAGVLTGGTLTLNGAGTPVTLVDAGQAAALTFAGTQGQLVTLNITNITISAGTVTISNPDGSVLMSEALAPAGVSFLPQLPMTGSYTVTVVPKGAVAGSFTAALSSTPAATLTVNQGIYNLVLANQNPVTLTFQGAAGGYLSLAASESNGLVNTATATILKPDGSQLTSSTFSFCNVSCGNGSGVISMGPLAEGGTYSAVIKATNSTGTGTLALTLASPVAGALPIGATTNVVVSLNGQGIAQTFNGVAGQYLSVATQSLNVNATGTLSIINPDGTIGATTPISGGTAGPNVLAFGPLESSGTYTVLQQQTSWPVMGTFAMTLAQPVNGGTISLGTATNATVVLPGGGIAETFSGTQGQYLSLTSKLQPSGNMIKGTVTVFDPLGAVLAVTPYSGQCISGVCNGGSVTNLSPAPSSGTYTALFQQTGAATGVTGTLSMTLAAPVSGTLAPGTSNISVPLAGQGFQESFSGTAGQYLSLAVEQGANSAGTLSIFAPNGVLISSAPYSSYCGSVCNSFGVVSLGPLSATGTYTALFQQADQAAPTSGTLVATLAGTLSGSLTVGTPANVAISSVGQGIQNTFNATVGQYYAVNVSEAAGNIPGAVISVLDATGTVLSKATLLANCSSSCAGSTAVNVGPIVATGTYTVLVQTSATAQFQGTGTLALAVTQSAAGSSNTWPLSTTTLGQAASVTFTGAAGQSFNLAFTNVTLTPSTVTSYLVQVIAPSGAGLTGAYCYTSSPACEVFVPKLTQSGTYTIKVTPAGQATLSMTATLSLDVTGTLTPGTPFSVNLATIGQGASLTFTAAAGQMPVLEIGGVATIPANTVMAVVAYDQNGNVVLNSNTSSALAVNFPSLTGGTYTVDVYPMIPATASLNVTIESPDTGVLPTNGTATNITDVGAEQAAHYTFAATAGQSVSIALSNLVFTPSTVNSVSVAVTQPDGTGIGGTVCYTSNSGCVLHLRLLETGTYSVSFSPGGLATMSLTATASIDVTGQLSSGIPLAVNLPSLGQSASLTFDVSSEIGQTVALYVGGVTSNPTSNGYYVTLYNFNKGETNIGSFNAPGIINLPSLAVGTYTAVIVPNAPGTGSMTVTLAPGVTNVLPVTGAGTSVSTSVPGQSVYLSFTGNAGQGVSLAISSLTLPGGGYLVVSVANPDGTFLISATCFPSNPGCEIGMMTLPQTGNYTITIATGQTTMSFVATMSSNAAGALISGTPLNVNLGTFGESTLLTFNATAGESVALSVSAVTTVPASQTLSIYIYNPSGAYVTNTSTSTSTQLNLTNLLLGTYSVFVSPFYPVTGSFTASYH